MYDVRTIDLAAQELLKKAATDEIETVWDRFDAQQPQCGFGTLGVCCRHCIQGPCRIDPFGQGPSKGICGVTADVIVARNLLRQVAAGSASHVDHAHDAVEALDLAAQGKIDYPITDEGKLRAIAAGLGLDSNMEDVNALALEVVQAAYKDMGNMSRKPMNWVVAHAPKERVEVWEKLGILPRNPDREIREALYQTTMGMDADPLNILLAIAKQGLVDGYAGLKLTTDMQDILFGTPAPVVTESNLGVLKEDYVNLVVHGHVPLLSEKIVQWARKLSPEAEAVGAKGIQVAGICCSGNEVLMRQGVPLATNYLAQELAIVTGAVDTMVVDVQCIMPSLSKIASCYHTELITTMPVVKIPGATHIPFSLENADESAQEIVRKAIKAFTKRDPKKVHIPNYRTTIMAGFSVEAISGALAKLDAEQPLKPLVDNIANGNILGVVATVGCNNVKVTQDQFHVEMVKELVKNNVLVVATGCSAHALAKAGLMNSEGTEEYAGETLKGVLKAIGEAAGLKAPLPPVLHMGSCVDNSRIGDLVTALANYLGVDSAALPVAASAPEPQHEKALSIGTWAVTMGITTHLGVVPPVLGSKEVTELLTNGLTEVIGGKFYVETEPIKAAQGLIEDIKEKRKKLGLK
ncbi:MAG: anaerobic carbon-monoxide dehydrogenase catalytic subunit [Desulfitobacterium sp.]|nr:anaerobic carbon-monoxide dehydrogenase catalytic subunit [Desulfitobacterium sp.]